MLYLSFFNEKLTPLHLAIWKGFLHLASTLLKAGSKTKVYDSFFFILS